MVLGIEPSHNNKLNRVRWERRIACSIIVFRHYSKRMLIVIEHIILPLPSRVWVKLARNNIKNYLPLHFYFQVCFKTEYYIGCMRENLIIWIELYDIVWIIWWKTYAFTKSVISALILWFISKYTGCRIIFNFLFDYDCPRSSFIFL